MKDFIFTSESVSEGHPDKICDQVSDAVLDACLAQDPDSRVACETLTTTDFICVAGEITSKASINAEEIARDVVRKIGYTHEDIGFNASTAKVDVRLHEQSPDISQGVTEGEGKFKEQGAGDQGLMFGLAINETESLMPLPIDLAHRLVKRLAELRHNGTLPFVLPDAKSQVSVEYQDAKPVRIRNIVISSQHKVDVRQEDLEEALIEQVIKPVIPAALLKDTQYLINPTGRFVVGGPHGDSGLTGRKIIVDTYGGYGRHGGGAFSGKDPSKVDRSAAYYARYVAKNIVAAGLASKCEIQVAYAIGYPDPVSVTIDTFGTHTIPETEIIKRVQANFDFKPAAIVRQLDLKNSARKYLETAAYGHFGRDGSTFTWEKTDRAMALKG